jgi:hypothetical protein
MLARFVEEHTENIILQERGSHGEHTERPAKVYLMRLPDEEAETKNVPYILLQVLTGSDTQEAGQEPDSECKVRIVFATFSEDYGAGAMDVLNLITRLRLALIKAGIVGDQFLLRKPLEYIVYPDDTAPYFFGEIMTTWEMPTIEREVNLYGWQDN